ncbi:hypothetical protein MHYP_G00336590 [Metynnis hypsauchen]
MLDSCILRVASKCLNSPLENQQVTLDVILNLRHRQSEEQDPPTLKVALQRARQTIEVQKKEIESLKEKMVFLDEDRSYLRETLSDALSPKGDTTRSSVPDEQMPDEQRQEEYRGL